MTESAARLRISKPAKYQAAYRARLENKRIQDRLDLAAADRLISLFYCEPIPGLTLDLSELMGTREQSLNYLHAFFSLQIQDAQQQNEEAKVTSTVEVTKKARKPRPKAQKK